MPQTLILDGLAVALLPAGIVIGFAEVPGDNIPYAGITLVGAGAGAYLFGAPIVHATHGRGWIGLASFGLRVLAPLAGASLGALAGGVSNSSQGPLVAFGAGAGALSAIVVDAAVLARPRWQPADPSPDPPPTPSFGLRAAPIVSFARGSGPRIGVAASF